MKVKCTSNGSNNPKFTVGKYYDFNSNNATIETNFQYYIKCGKKAMIEMSRDGFANIQKCIFMKEA